MAAPTAEVILALARRMEAGSGGSSSSSSSSSSCASACAAASGGGAGGGVGGGGAHAPPAPPLTLSDVGIDDRMLRQLQNAAETAGRLDSIVSNIFMADE